MINNEKSLVEQLNESTEKMDKKNLKHMLKDLETAYKNGDRQKLAELSVYFKEVSDCLGTEDESVLKENLSSINAEIEKNGASALNIANYKNTKAKLSIVKYRPEIKEAAEFDGYPVLYKKMTDRKSVLLVGGSLITMFGLMAGCSIKNKIDNENTETSLTSTSAIYSTTEGETSNYSSETIEETSLSTSDYSIQTLDIDYSSPTRNTNTTNVNNGGNGSGNGNNGNGSKVKNINPTHNPTDVSVISAPTTAAPTTTTTTTTTGKSTEPTQTSAIPTNSNGQKVDDSGEPVQTTYIAPTGTDPLPIEPTKTTLSDDDLLKDPTTTTTTAEPTKAPTNAPAKTPEDPTTTTTAEPTTTTTKSTEPVSTTIEVPVVTVDPNDPANVKEDCQDEIKVLSLKMR